MKNRKYKIYKINEIFYSIQGEGVFAGVPAIFVRFAGCNLNCSFCDTDFSCKMEMSSDEIMEKVLSYGCEHIVATGGEPLLQMDRELLEKMHENDFYVQLETNGTINTDLEFNWVTCSPKLTVEKTELKRINELKLLWMGEQETEKKIFAFSEYFKNNGYAPLACIQPISGENIPQIISFIKKYPKIRISVQLHKLIGVK